MEFNHFLNSIRCSLFRLYADGFFQPFLNRISFLPHLLVYTPFQSCETYMLFPICHLFCEFTFEVNLLYSVQLYMSIISINSTGKIRFICIATFFIQITYTLHPNELYVNIFITSRFNSSQHKKRTCLSAKFSPFFLMLIGSE